MNRRNISARTQVKIKLSARQKSNFTAYAELIGLSQSSLIKAISKRFLAQPHIYLKIFSPSQGVDKVTLHTNDQKYLDELTLRAAKFEFTSAEILSGLILQELHEQTLSRWQAGPETQSIRSTNVDSQ